MTALPTPTRPPRTVQLSLALDNDELRPLDPNERDQATRHPARLPIEAAGLGREGDRADDVRPACRHGTQPQGGDPRPPVHPPAGRQQRGEPAAAMRARRIRPQSRLPRGGGDRRRPGNLRERRGPPARLREAVHRTLRAAGRWRVLFRRIKARSERTGLAPAPGVVRRVRRTRHRPGRRPRSQTPERSAFVGNVMSGPT